MGGCCLPALPVWQPGSLWFSHCANDGAGLDSLARARVPEGHPGFRTHPLFISSSWTLFCSSWFWAEQAAALPGPEGMKEAVTWVGSPLASGGRAGPRAVGMRGKGPPHPAPPHRALTGSPTHPHSPSCGGGCPEQTACSEFSSALSSRSAPLPGRWGRAGVGGGGGSRGRATLNSGLDCWLHFSVPPIR